MKLLKQIAQLFTQLKAVSGAISAVAIIAGCAIWITSTVNNSSDLQDANFDRVFDSLAVKDANFDRVFDSLAVMNQNIEYLSIENSNQDETLQNILDTIERFEKEHKEQGRDISSLIWAVKNKDGLTKEQLENTLDEMLKKNIELNPASEIGLIPSEWLMSPNTDLRGMSQN